MNMELISFGENNFKRVTPNGYSNPPLYVSLRTSTFREHWQLFQIVDDELISTYKIETDKRNWQDVVRLAFLRSWISCSLSGDMVLDLTLRVDFLMGPLEDALWCFDPCMKCFVSLRKQIYKNEH